MEAQGTPGTPHHLVGLEPAPSVLLRAPVGPCHCEAARMLNITFEYAGVKCPEDKPYIESFIAATRQKRSIAMSTVDLPKR